jgi:porphobilinogen deaminase
MDLRPDLELRDLRGNVPTRIAKLRRGDYDAILIAQAGILRLELELEDLWSRPLAIEKFVPAPGQGMLAVQCRDEDALVASLQRLHSEEAARCVDAERWLLAKLEGCCQLPFGAHVNMANQEYHLLVFWQPAEGAPFRMDLLGADPQEMAKQCLRRMRDREVRA